MAKDKKAESITRVENSTFFNQQKPLYTEHNKRIYIGSGKKIHIFSFTSGKLLQILHGHDAKVIGIRVHPINPDSIISCDTSGCVIAWSDNAKSNEVVKFNSPSCEENEVTFFDMDEENSFLLAFNNGNQKSNLYMYQTSATKKPVLVVEDVLLGCNKISKSPKHNFLVAIGEKTLSVHNYPYMKSKSNKKTIGSTHLLAIPATCVECHPTENMIAVGNSIGAIHLWHSLDRVSPYKKKLHWHSLPVPDLSFSCSGSDLYSVGEECVAIIWRHKTDKKQVIPRLGMPLTYIAAGEENAVCLHVDNDITLIDGINHTTQGKLETQVIHTNPATEKLPVGLLYDPKTRSIITNGWVGHLQFYEPRNQKRLFNLDITVTNYASRERIGRIANPSVEKAAISDDGQSLATYDTCLLANNLQEVNLKFWQLSSKKNSWELNTFTHKPHSEKINAICFAPASAAPHKLCVTLSDDGKAKFWKMNPRNADKDKRNVWECDAVREYRDLPCVAGSFTFDGAAIALAFDGILTIWDVSDISLLGTCYNSRYTETIRDVYISTKEKEGSIAVTRSDNSICAYDLLSNEFMWAIDLISTTCMAVDPSSGVLAVFYGQKTQKVNLYRASCAEPMHTFDLEDTEILGAVFIASEDSLSESLYPWKSRNILYYINENQVVCSLTHKKEGEEKTMVQSRLCPDAADPNDKALLASIAAPLSNIISGSLANDTANYRAVKASVYSEILSHMHSTADVLVNAITESLEHRPQPLNKANVPMQRHKQNLLSETLGKSGSVEEPVIIDHKPWTLPKKKKLNRPFKW